MGFVLFVCLFFFFIGKVTIASIIVKAVDRESHIDVVSSGSSWYATPQLYDMIQRGQFFYKYPKGLDNWNGNSTLMNVQCYYEVQCPGRFCRWFWSGSWQGFTGWFSGSLIAQVEVGGGTEACIYICICIYIYTHICNVSLQALGVLHISGLIHSPIKSALISPSWPMN